MAPTIAPSGNFLNPVGLLFRMLTSGKRAAYAALFHEALRLVARPVDAILKGKEARITAEGCSIRSAGHPCCGSAQKRDDAGLSNAGEIHGRELCHEHDLHVSELPSDRKSSVELVAETRLGRLS